MRTRNPAGDHIMPTAAAPIPAAPTEAEVKASPATPSRNSAPETRTKLNEAVVKAVPEAGNKVHYFPGAILEGKEAPRGFGVRVSSGGVKSFLLNYRIKLRERRYTIGQWPDWSVLDAVNEARILRQRIDRGEDPLDERDTVAKDTTLKAIAEDYLADQCGLVRHTDGKVVRTRRATRRSTLAGAKFGRASYGSELLRIGFSRGLAASKSRTSNDPMSRNYSPR